jgi:hypothetical protein
MINESQKFKQLDKKIKEPPNKKIKEEMKRQTQTLADTLLRCLIYSLSSSSFFTIINSGFCLIIFIANLKI